MMNEEIVVAGLPLSFPKPTGNQLPTLAEWNQRYIEYVLNYTKGKKTAAARILGINRRTLYRRKKVRSNQPDEMDALNGSMHHSPSENPMSGMHPTHHQVQ